MFLLVPVHPGCPGQNPESRKMVVLCVCVPHLVEASHNPHRRAHYSLVLLHCSVASRGGRPADAER